MIIGMGLDVVEIDRFGKQAHPRLAERILTEKEREGYTGSSRRRKEYLAGRFAAKEALAKAAGTGIGRHIGWHDIEVLPDGSGAPKITVTPPVLERLGWQCARIHLSIAHGREIAVAHVIVEQS